MRTLQRGVYTSQKVFNELPLGERLKVLLTACCANPQPQLMYDSNLKRMVLQCMNCGAFVG